MVLIDSGGNFGNTYINIVNYMKTGSFKCKFFPSMDSQLTFLIEE